MILFISHYPNSETEKEGMMQRISTIDKVFENEERIYAHISGNIETNISEPHITTISDKLRICNINFYLNIHYRMLRDLVLEAKVVYVHSIYNAQYILPFYKYKKIITDMHGIVPEEQHYYGNEANAKLLERIEKFVIENSYCIITVTNSMSNHFLKKYPHVNTKMMVLPTLDNHEVDISNKPKASDKSRMLIIYSGGAQKWQNIDMMLDSIYKVRDRFDFMILTNDVAYFQSQIKKLGYSDIVKVCSVPKKNIQTYYCQADFGFILRDNIAINQVACPTKLSEYLSFGVIPIVLQPDIGDFKALGYSYLTLSDFLNNNPPSSPEIEFMKSKNYETVNKLRNTFNASIRQLIDLKEELLSNSEDSEIFLTNEEIIGNDKDAHIKNLETIIYDKDAHIKNLETIVKDKDMLIDDIRNTRGWRALEQLRRFRNLLFRLFNYLRGHKVNTFLKKRNKYEEWIRRSEPSPAELDLQKKTTFNCYPKISIVVPTYNTPEQFLKEMVESVINQTYSNWELCIADGGSNKPYIREILNSYTKKDERIKVKFLTENKGIAGNSNEALSLATGDFIALLDHDDTIAPFALYEVVKGISKNPDADFIYSDEDKISEDGKKQFDPHFKPDWSPDTLRSYNYICHLTVIKKALLYKVGFFRGDYEGSQDYDLIFRATEDANKILHIPKVLYHWRAHLSSAAGDVSNKMYAIESGKKAVADHLKRIGLTGTAEGGWPYKVVYNCKDSPLISIIIPNKDHTKDLGKCVESIISKSSYNNFEIIIIENRSVEKDTFELYSKLEQLKNVRIIKWDHLFNFGSLNNFAVNYAEGEVLLFLNNDTEVITSDWLECMLGHVLRKEIGAVGAKLYYPDNTIQHAGVILGIKGVAGHSHKYFPRDSKGYFCRANIIQNLSAVTAACMMMRREVFEEVGRFDERYSHAFNDVDLCMKIRQKGYLIVFTPYAELYHHESKSRGNEDTREKQERFKKEIEYFQKKWKNDLAKGDPYYNPNLTLDREDFSIKI